MPLDSFTALAGDSHGHDEAGQDGDGDHYEMRSKWSTLIDGSFHL